MEQSVSRRGFLGAAIGTGAAAAMAPTAFAAGRDQGATSLSGSVPGNRRSSQLYSWRRIMDRSQADAEGMLRALAGMGYTQVERAGRYGWTAQQFKSVLDRYGLWAHSSHDGPGFPATAGWEKAWVEDAIPYAKALGQKFIGFAWFPSTTEFPYTSEATWHELAKHLNAAGKLASDAGLQFFYHNHDFELRNRFNGKPAYDILLSETNPDWVKFELDLVLDRLRRRESRPLPVGRPCAVPAVPRQGPHMARPPERSGLGGRRARLDRLPGHLRRR